MNNSNTCKCTLSISRPNPAAICGIYATIIIHANVKSSVGVSYSYSNVTNSEKHCSNTLGSTSAVLLSNIRIYLCSFDRSSLNTISSSIPCFRSVIFCIGDSCSTDTKSYNKSCKYGVTSVLLSGTMSCKNSIALTITADSFYWWHFLMI